MINSLTEEQKSHFQEWVDKWIAIGLSTEPANFEEAERGVRGCYKAAGLVPPPITRVGSPIVACIAGPIAESMLSHNHAVDSAVDSAVRSVVRSAVSSAVDSAVSSAVSSEVGSAVYSAVSSAVYSAVNSAVYSAVYSAVNYAVNRMINSSVYSAIRSAVYSSVNSGVNYMVDHEVQSEISSRIEYAVYSAVNYAVGSVVDSAVGSAVNSAVGSAVGSAINSATVRSSWNNYRGGSFWAGWYAYISFYRDVCGYKHDSLNTFMYDELHALNAGLCWYGKHCCFLSDRPSKINILEDRLHCETGPSIEFRDGWSLWHIHGVQVPKDVVMYPEKQTISNIEEESNSEVKRIRIERYGWLKYLSETNASVIDHANNYIDATEEALMQSKDGMKLLVCACPSTARTYAMRVPREIENCVQAQLWLKGSKPKHIIGAS